MNNRKLRLLIGVFILIIVGIVGYFEYTLSKFQGIQEVICYQVKNGAIILPGDTLAINTNVVPVLADANKIPQDYIKSQSDLNEVVATVMMFGSDVITTKKITQQSKYYEDNERYVCLSSKDINSFSGNEVRPGDTIDILIYDPVLKSYVQKEEYKNLFVLDIRNQDSTSFKDFKSTDFKIQSVYFKMNNDVYTRLLTDLSISDSKFTVMIHGVRPYKNNIQTPTSSDNNNAGNAFNILN